MTHQATVPGLAVADALPQPVWTARPDGAVDYANPAWRAYTGFGEAASLGSGWADAVHPDDAAAIEARFRAASEAGEPYEVEYRFRRSDGAYRWHLARVGPIRDPGGTLVGWAGTAVDVDERRRTEHALRESEARYRTLFASIDEGFCVVEVLVDAEGHAADYRFLEANPAFARHTGLRGATGRRMRELAPDHEAHWFATYGRVAATGEPVRFVAEAQALGGRTFEVYAFRLGPPERRQVAILFADVTERQRAEAGLARLAAVVEGSQEAIIARSLDGTITAWNPGAARLYGYAADEIIGRDVALLIPPDHKDELPDINERLGRGEHVPAFETVRLRKDGTRVEVEITISPIRDGAGRVVGVSAIARDVGERRRRGAAERVLLAAGTALAASLDPEATLRALAGLAVPGLADWCVVHLAEGGGLRRVAVAHADPAQAALAEELQARYPTDPAARHGPAHVARTGTPELVAGVTDGQLAAYARDAGHLRLMRAVAVGSYLTVPLRARSRVLGTLTLMNGAARRPLEEADVGIAQELADRAALAVDNARLYRAAQAAETRYRGLFEGVADAILVADAGRRYTDANAAAEELLGYARAELLGLRVEDVVAAEPSWTAAEFARFRDEGRWQGELELRRKDGTTVPVEARATVVDLPDGPVNISAVRDASERRLAQRQQQEFLEAVSHDLKNPLAAVRAQAQLLGRRARRGAVAPEALAEAVATIEAATRRLEAQLDELQDAARLRSGHALELRAERVDLVALAEAAAADARAASPRHRVTVAAAEPVVGWWDPLRLRRVLDNLLNNAVKYSPEGTAVVTAVAAEERGDGTWAVLTVRDEGVGIPAADLPHVFERYRRGSNVGTHTRGAGIGLAGVRQIAEQHGGTVLVESQEGRGSTFVIALPLEVSAQQLDEGNA